MELKDKLQLLRKQKGLTQEELAERLYVSRAAVSKWESGRGYPNIDSLKAIAKCFSVTVDELLSCDEMLTIAQEEGKQRAERLEDLVYGLLDCSAVMLLFLPLFGQREAETIRGVSLPALTGTAPYVKVAYFSIVIGLMAIGLLTLALQNGGSPVWLKNKRRLSVACSVAAVLLLIVSLQPYPAVFLFVFLAIKAFLLVKRQ